MLINNYLSKLDIKKILIENLKSITVSQAEQESQIMISYLSNSENNLDLYSGKHRAYFESWDHGRNIKDPKVVIQHDSNGLFLNNFETSCLG